MPRYRIYGLIADSDLEFPELIPAQDPPAVKFRCEDVQVPPEARSSGKHYWSDSSVAYVFQDEWGALRIHDGQEISVCQAPGIDPLVVRMWVLGPGIAILLHQRSMLVLHASVVEYLGVAIAFLGDTGAGKSTTAMALSMAGAGFLSDDHLVVGFDGDQVLAQPGHPQLKLNPDVLLGLGLEPSDSPKLYAFEEKRGYRVGRRFLDRPLQLGLVYILSDGEALRSISLSPREAFMHLVQHSFLAKILSASGALERHFTQCARLAAGVPFRWLVRPRSLRDLTGLVEFILGDASHSR